MRPLAYPTEKVNVPQRYSSIFQLFRCRALSRRCGTRALQDEQGLGVSLVPDDTKPGSEYLCLDFPRPEGVLEGDGRKHAPSDQVVAGFRTPVRPHEPGEPRDDGHPAWRSVALGYIRNEDATAGEQALPQLCQGLHTALRGRHETVAAP